MESNNEPQNSQWCCSVTIPPGTNLATQGTIYLIHFDKPYHHAKHYLGWAHNQHFEARLEHHRNGNGSRLMAAVARAGIGWKVVRTWRGSRADERRMKNNGAVGKYCPICRKNPRGTKSPILLEKS
jgi:hypothetical protein